MTKKATDIICYISFVGWLVAFFAGTRKESKFHLNQALTANAGFLILNIASRLIPYFLFKGLIFWALDMFLLVITIIALVGACKGEEKVLPVLGGISILNDSVYDKDFSGAAAPSAPAEDASEENKD
ncbi:MAG: hypothetical protein VZQ97_06825 [Candidatus Onthomonas sp.]|nr:hypothetical protein [Candidatus Onthomonas sp.]